MLTISRIKQTVQKGFTLIEAMIAVVVFSFGLLGVAGVMIVSVKNNHNGYLRSQAIFLANSIVDSMSSNSQEVWNNSYNGNYGYPSGFSSVANMCTDAAPCTCVGGGIATRETQLWSNMLIQQLPNGSGSIQCVPATAQLYVPANCQEIGEPYLGICTITVTWNESNETNSASLQTLTLEVNP